MGRPNFTPHLGLAGALAIFSTCLAAQSRLPDRLVFAETDRIRLFVPAGRGDTGVSHILAQQLASSEYSLDYAYRVLVPAMGGAIATGDFDGDGWIDLSVVLAGRSNSLFRNNGDSTFEDVTAKAGISGPPGSLSSTFADYDHSGRLSLFVAGASGIALYRNNGNGTFSNVTQAAGLLHKPGELCTGAVLADVDGDGDQDLLVTVYTDLKRPPVKTAFTFPNDFPGTASQLYRNDGNGSFTNVTASSGFGGNPGRARQAVFADFDNDQSPDLLILRDDKPPAFYLNRGNGSFKDASWDAGRELTGHAFFHAVTADFNRDGRLDVALWSTIGLRVLLNDGHPAFQPAESLPLISSLATPFGFHGTAADLNGDGFPDLLTLDNQRRWHVFVNRTGFEKAALHLFPESDDRQKVAALTPLRLGKNAELYLLELHLDGRIVALKEATSSGRR